MKLVHPSTFFLLMALFCACNLSPNIDLPSHSSEPEGPKMGSGEDPSGVPPDVANGGAAGSTNGGAAGTANCTTSGPGAGGKQQLPRGCESEN